MSSILKPVVIFLLLSGLPKEHSFPIEWFRITPQWNVGAFFFFFGHLEFTSGANALCFPMGKKRNLGIIPLKPTAFFMPLRGQNKGFELFGVCVCVCMRLQGSARSEHRLTPLLTHTHAHTHTHALTPFPTHALNLLGHLNV